MSLTLVLPWFPIVLAVGVGARLLGRHQGTAFGVLAALFWVVLVQAVTGPAVFTGILSTLSLLSGAVAIVAIGAWSGSMSGSVQNGRTGPTKPDPEGWAKRLHRTGAEARICSPPASRDGNATRLTDALARFEEWLESHRYAPDPWPEFGEFIRSTLNELCGATHVRPYRALSEGDVLIPLRAFAPGEVPDVLPARVGIVGHVVTSGASYVAGNPAGGKLVEQLARESKEGLAWCFAVKQGTRKIGVVMVGELPPSIRADLSLLSFAEALVCQHWATLAEVCRSRTAETRDPVSGVLAREPFLIEANRALSVCYAQKEPAVIAIVALEGTRLLSDRGDWELGDLLIAEASSMLLERLRPDDRLGRFDDSRFVVLLRRVDSALGSLIVDQLLAKLSQVCGDAKRWGRALGVRCGVAGTGGDHPSLAELISRAINECQAARRAHRPVLSDLEDEGAPAGEGLPVHEAGDHDKATGEVSSEKLEVRRDTRNAAGTVEFEAPSPAPGSLEPESRPMERSAP